MNKNIIKHIVDQTYSVKDVLKRFDLLGLDAIVFYVDMDKRLLGSLTDGDIRRGIIKGLNLDNDICNFILPNPRYILKGNYDLDLLQQWRIKNFRVIPVLNDNHQVVDIINFRLQKSYLPMDAVIMAGGKGTRLHPLTLQIPKPLLKIAGKPIIEYNIDRLKEHGVKNLTISIKYLGHQIVDYFQDGSSKEINIKYIEEDKPLGTVGAVRLMDEISNDYILVMNSDLLTNIDFEDMFLSLIKGEGDMIVATTSYEVRVPYGVVETEDDKIVSLKEKPIYTYYSNAGIYIFKRKFIDLIPHDAHFNATDLIEKLLCANRKVINYPILGYWLDIGKHEDFEKAQKDVEHIIF